MYKLRLQTCPYFCRTLSPNWLAVVQVVWLRTWLGDSPMCAKRFCSELKKLVISWQVYCCLRFQIDCCVELFGRIWVPALWCLLSVCFKPAVFCHAYAAAVVPFVWRLARAGWSADVLFVRVALFGQFQMVPLVPHCLYSATLRSKSRDSVYISTLAAVKLNPNLRRACAGLLAATDFREFRNARPVTCTGHHRKASYLIQLPVPRP